MMWGKSKESGIWIARVSNWRLMFCHHDSLYIAAGRFRFRVMKRIPGLAKEARKP